MKAAVKIDTKIDDLETEEFSLESMDKILKRFEQINRIRLQRVMAILTQRQQEFVHLLPLIFHKNIEGLPGFVENSATGIPNYEPSAEAKHSAKKLLKSFKYAAGARLQFEIEGIYLMGSCGTIAFSESSDLDIWLCYRPGLSSHQIAQLHDKSEQLTRWADEMDLEITIFVINNQEFRQGKSTPLSLESSGSSQHLLLLEEFYRTAILLAGKYPAWWLVPPGEENHYDDYLQAISKKHLKDIDSRHFLDFGSVKNIPSDEFLGATVWQIYKGIDSPYKSILKLMLMEAYAAEFPDIQLLSLIFKHRIYYHKKITIDEVDPYVVLMEKLSTFLQSINSEERLFLVRQCFYLKIHCSVSTGKHRAASAWRMDMMRNYVNDWGWDNYTVQMLDFQHNWKLSDVIKEQKRLIDALTNSYRKLSDFFSRYNRSSRISSRDLHLLGRKLHAAFERKAGKIEIVNRQYGNQLLEEQISFHEFITPTNDKGWKVFQGLITRKEMDNLTALNQSANLMKLITWLYFNGAINQHTNFLIYNHKNIKLNSQEVNWLIADLGRFYPRHKMEGADLEMLSKPSIVEKNLVFVNVGKDPFDDKSLGKNQIATSRTDSLKYGAKYKNLILSIDIIYNSSWKELMYVHYHGHTAILECLMQYLRWNNEEKSSRKILPDLVSSYSSTRSKAIADRVNEVIHDVITAFNQIKSSNQKYLLALGDFFYLIGFENLQPVYQKIGTMNLLIKELSMPSKIFTTLTVDKQVTDDLNLQAVYRENKAGKIQFFFMNYIKNVDIYILDDKGTLYYQRRAIEEHNVQLNHMILFLQTIIDRRRFNPSMDVSIGFDNDLDLFIYKMLREEGEIVIRKQRIDQFPLPRQFLKIQAIGHILEGKPPYFSIFCDDIEFSALEYGNQVYHELARFVVNNRPSGLRYPIYLTDMDLNQDNVISDSSQNIQISQLLKHKEQLEKKLNAAIKEI